MKKLTLIAVLFLILGLAFTFGTDVDTIKVSGSVGMSFGDDVLGDEVGPKFTATKTGAFASIAVGTANDKVSAGVTVSLLPLISWTDNSIDYNGEAGTTGGFDGITAMIDFYVDNMQGVTYVDDDGVEQTFADIDFNALEDAVEATTGVDFVIYGNPTDGWAVEDDEDTILGDNYRDHLIDLGSAVWTAIDNEIAGMSAIYTSTASSDGDVYPQVKSPVTIIRATWTDAQKAAADAEQEMQDDWEAAVYGTAADDSWAASTPVTGAFMRLNALFGILDMEFEVNGKAVAVGSMVTSDITKGEAFLGLTLGLDEAVVPGLMFNVLFTDSSNRVAAVDDDTTTYADESADKDPNEYGLQFNVGYTFASDAMSVGAKATFGIKEIMDTDVEDGNIIIGIMPSFSMPGVAGLNVGAEFSLLPAADGTNMGIGLGASVGASVMGISPTVKFYFKNDAFGVIDGASDTSAMGAFNGATGALALNVGIAVDLAELIGMKLVTLNLGGDMVSIDPETYLGFSAGLGLNFADVLGQPLTLGFNISQFGDNVLGWEASLGYTYAELLGITGAFGYSPDDEALYYSVGGSVSF
jgi:hypothetical protein